MRGGGENFSNAKCRQFVGGIFDAFNFQPDAVQHIRNHVYIGVGIEMLLEPA